MSKSFTENSFHHSFDLIKLCELDLMTEVPIDKSLEFLPLFFAPILTKIHDVEDENDDASVKSDKRADIPGVKNALFLKI